MKKKKHDKMVLLAESKLNSIENLLSKVLIEENIILNEFVLMNNVLKEYHNVKKEDGDLNSLSRILVYL